MWKWVMISVAHRVPDWMIKLSRPLEGPYGTWFSKKNCPVWLLFGGLRTDADVCFYVQLRATTAVHNLKHGLCQEKLEDFCK